MKWFKIVRQIIIIFHVVMNLQVKQDRLARPLLYYIGIACTTHSSPGLSTDAKILREEEHYDDRCSDQWNGIRGNFDRSFGRSPDDGHGNGCREVTGNQVCPATSPTFCFRYAAGTIGLYDPTPLHFLNSAR
jgi:hypothetical protein